MKPAFLGLGSNLGDRRRQLTEALRALAADPAVTIVQGSSVYESKAMGDIVQPDFFNLVVEIRTAHAPLGLLDACLAIEAGLGRVRRERWGPRTIDLDILFYENVAQNDTRLVLPHPGITQRAFVLTPLAEIAPDLMIQGRRVRDHAAQIGAADLTRVLSWAELSAGFGSNQSPLRPS